MGKMNINEMRNLCNTIRDVGEPMEERNVAKSFTHSLTEMAGQVPSDEEVELTEKAAPGMEDWASDPKVKASFKKQYGKRWKQVMYAKSWKMSKMHEETDELEEGYQAKRLRMFRKASKNEFAKFAPGTEDFMKRSFKRKVTRDNAISGGRGSVRALDIRRRKKAAALKAKGLAEETLVEGLLKKLRRAKGAAYKADLASRGMNPQTPKQDIELNNKINKYAKLHKVASGLESRYKASMARRGGASPEAVKGAGSRRGPSGKHTLKAGKLASQHDKAMSKFRAKSLFGKAQGEDKVEKRYRQQALAQFANKARSGDFGQNNQEALRARSNFQKRYGRLKGK